LWEQPDGQKSFLFWGGHPGSGEIKIRWLQFGSPSRLGPSGRAFNRGRKSSWGGAHHAIHEDGCQTGPAVMALGKCMSFGGAPGPHRRSFGDGFRRGVRRKSRQTPGSVQGPESGETGPRTHFNGSCRFLRTKAQSGFGTKRREKTNGELGKTMGAGEGPSPKVKRGGSPNKGRQFPWFHRVGNITNLVRHGTSSEHAAKVPFGTAGLDVALKWPGRARTPRDDEAGQKSYSRGGATARRGTKGALGAGISVRNQERRPFPSGPSFQRLWKLFTGAGRSRDARGGPSQAGWGGALGFADDC